jgi:hypothetical protein
MSGNIRLCYFSPRYDTLGRIRSCEDRVSHVRPG